MCDHPDKIMEDNIVVQELDDYIESNKIGPMNKLLLRGVKQTLVTSIQNKQDIEEVKHDVKDMKECPSVTRRFRDKPLRVSAEVFSLSLVLFIVFHVLTLVIGIDELILIAIP